MGAFTMVVQYLHDVADGAEPVCLMKEVLCETGGWADVSEITSVFIVV
jgi:hypothetical protein